MSIKQFEIMHQQQNICTSGESPDILLEEEEYDIDPEIQEILNEEQAKA